MVNPIGFNNSWGGVKMLKVTDDQQAGQLPGYHTGGLGPPKLLAEAKGNENERTKAERLGLWKARLQRD